ncbi:hypothetical protein NQ318_010470 [Aromia moschata]|uniref:Uncharacterized protein n=1 Tax=Aromia moschata TaxID=1265417 RepID=A0AAV8YB24_9CUCU|nr:hypothetical protein NQ318_010470 [Aromia moschata]
MQLAHALDELNDANLQAQPMRNVGFGIQQMAITNNAGEEENQEIIPRSVNYHFTRKCNYECGFCFHTAKTSYMLNLQDAKMGLKLLKDSVLVLRRETEFRIMYSTAELQD